MSCLRLEKKGGGRGYSKKREQCIDRQGSGKAYGKQWASLFRWGVMLLWPGRRWWRRWDWKSDTDRLLLYCFLFSDLTYKNEVLGHQAASPWQIKSLLTKAYLVPSLALPMKPQLYDSLNFSKLTIMKMSWVISHYFTFSFNIVWAIPQNREKS